MSYSDKLEISDDVAIAISTYGEVEIFTVNEGTRTTNSITMSIEEAIQLADIIKACVPN